ncbi:MAG: DUF58 domain-containing protein [Lentimicrobium sp.]|jgi:uncharacterized protein (DUF58 family)|nr:DUF58 domain-containing protein [Lentimicrobium sp.]MDD2526663.1 DUF58 domain-containing protein [Lentimicrobiaceae bacterium]MDD4596847.1 DUF58 domain-containing protein [Lentimicrobiaceae bacterium]MDY0025294.1 DUF58 domain-containing protein [Lentimicrobium sp.]HAH60374.1 DUF58 domain-containing protein [Bacteroidales bacterium]
MPINIDQSRFDEFSPLELLARQVVEGFITGLHKSPFHGFSVEFAEHRLYNQGESVRNIDWKLYGRTDRLYVKRYEEETNLRCQLVIDASSSMYFPLEKKANPESPDKISFSVYAAAALLHLLRRQRDAAGLTVFTNEVKLHTGAHSNLVHMKRLYTELEKLLNNKEAHSGQTTSAASTLHQIAENIHKRSLVVVFSDMLDEDPEGNEVFNALQHLKHNKHEVILFHVADKQFEIDFDFENKPYRFIDMETREEIKIRPHELREGYRERMKAFTQELNLRCAQYHIDLVRADINLGYKQILLPYLLKRVKMH